jgi:hypothetical protein
MNIQSEIEYFTDLSPIDKARFLLRILYEIAEEAKLAAGGGNEAARHRLALEMAQRLSRFSFELLSEDPHRPADDVVLRMLLARRVDKTAERMLRDAYRRVLTSFEGFDSTVLLNTH